MSDFPEFRQKLGQGYFSLELPKKADKIELAQALQQYDTLRKQFEQSPVIDLTSTDVGDLLKI
jgi:hypothetical protein